MVNRKVAASVNARVGCAGWSLPAQYRQSFPGVGTALERYASVFNATEINSSFYRPHKHATYARWGDSVKEGFRFSVKLPRTITHDRHLKAIAAELKTFLAECTGLGPRLGGVLVQLPPSLAFNSRVAKAFFERLRGQLGTGVGIACEPRHASWFAPAPETLWRAYDVNRVGADPTLVADAALPGTVGKWRYWRLHGSPQMYYSRYAPETLADLADNIVGAAAKATPWVIFDNTAAGHAVGNALALKQLLGQSRNPGTGRA